MPYCANCGKEIEEEARFCSYCGSAVGGVARELKTEEIDVPYPDATPARLEIEIRSAGRVNVSGGTKGGFVEGTVEYDIPEMAPRVDVSGNRVRVVQARRFWDNVRTNPINRWDLRLGDERPFSMDVKCGVSMGRWELGGLPITDLQLEAGVSSNVVTFESPNPERLERFKLGAGAGDVEILGLLNSNFHQMKVEGGVGDVKLGFTGKELDHDATVDIGGGVGSYRITVDESVPVRARVEGMVSVTALGEFRKMSRGRFPLGGEYTNDAYETSKGPALELDITMGVGSVTLDTR
jgi:hypothetical protein